MVDATRFFWGGGGCMVASRGRYRMARGWHHAKLSLSNAARLSFSDLCILFKKNLNASKPSEHPPQVEECLKV